VLPNHSIIEADYSYTDRHSLTLQKAQNLKSNSTLTQTKIFKNSKENFFEETAKFPALNSLEHQQIIQKK